LPRLDQNPVSNIGSLHWNDLVLMKRNLSLSIREVTQQIIDIDANTLPRLNQEIQKTKKEVKQLIVKSNHNRMSIQSANSDLLDLSGKIRQSKNFLSMMQNRLPEETEETLLQVSKINQSLIDRGNYGSTREKDQILSVIRDASMKVDAIRAFRAIKEQLQHLESQCQVTKISIRTLDDESRLLQGEISKCKGKIQNLFDTKRQAIEEREDCLSKYNQISMQLEKVNAQLDLLAEARRRQRQDHPRPVYNADVSKAKEFAKKKLQSGAKLSLEELRLLYNENEY
jgi:uncharacterized coiled-coil DUF342 family protein